LEHHGAISTICCHHYHVFAVSEDEMRYLPSNQSAAANRRGRRPFNGSGITTQTLRSTVAVPAVAELGR
jgi:hypothetical protein